jgi:hypothetical protein
MIVFSIAVPVDLPPELMTFIRRTVDAIRVYLVHLGHEPITAEIKQEEDRGDE